MTFTVLVALSWLAFLAGFLVGCAWANAVARPRPAIEYAEPNADCGHACGYDPRYGFVPEADCPVHDPPPSLPDEEREPMSASKPRGICWCDCHTPIDENGKRVFGPIAWPSYADSIAFETACINCRSDHVAWIARGVDPLVDKRA